MLVTYEKDVSQIRDRCLDRARISLLSVIWNLGRRRQLNSSPGRNRRRKQRRNFSAYRLLYRLLQQLHDALVQRLLHGRRLEIGLVAIVSRRSSEQA